MAFELAWLSAELPPPPPAISRDAGASFPVVATGSGTISTVTSAAFSTSAATTLIVVTVSWNNFSSTAQHPITSVAWSGGSGASPAFTKRIEGASTGSGANVMGVSIWTAEATSQVVGRAIVVTASASAASSNASVSIDALIGASPTPGLSGSTASASGSSVARSVTLASVTSGSWVYVGAVSETGPLSPVTSTTEFNEQASGGCYAATGVNTTGTSGSVNVGWSASATWSAAAALEIALA